MFKISCLKLLLLVTMLGLGGVSSVQAAAANPIVVINRGIGGHNSQKVLNRFARDVIDLKPKHVVLMVGTNDVVNSHALVDIASYEQNVEQMLTQLSDAGVQHVVMVTLPPVVEAVLDKRTSVGLANLMKCLRRTIRSSPGWQRSMDTISSISQPSQRNLAGLRRPKNHSSAIRTTAAEPMVCT